MTRASTVGVICAAASSAIAPTTHRVLLGLVSGGGIPALALLIPRLVRRRPLSGGGLLAPSML